MKITRLKIQNFQGITHRELDLSAPGVIVVQGDNETGKSTMIKAIDLLLDEKDTSKKSDVRSIKPVDADVGSRVEADIETGPYRFTYTKQWNKERSTVMRIVAPYHAQFTGEEAHAKVLSILDETLDRHLWKALRYLQGDSLSGQPDFLKSSALTQALDAMSAPHTPDALEDTGSENHWLEQSDQDSLFAKIAAQYQEFFDTSGKERKSLKEARKNVEDARVEVQHVEQELAEIDQDSERHQRLLLERDALVTTVEATTREVEQHTVQSGRHKELNQQWERESEKARSIRLELQNAQSNLDLRVNKAKEILNSTKEIAERSQRITEATERLDELVSLRETYRSERQKVHTDLDVLKRQRDKAIQARSALMDRRELTRLTALAEKVTALTQQRIQIERTLHDQVDISAETLTHAEELQHEITELAGRLSAVSGRLDISAAVPTQLAEGDDARYLAPGTEVSLPLSGKVSINIPETVTVIFTPDRNVAELNESMAEKRAALDGIFETVQVNSLNELRHAKDKQHDQQQEAETVADRSRELLESSTLTEKQLAERIAVLQQKLNSTESSPLPEQSASDIKKIPQTRENSSAAAVEAKEQSDENKLSTKINDLDRQQEQLEQSRQKANELYTEADKEIVRLRTEIAHLTATQEAATNETAKLQEIVDSLEAEITSTALRKSITEISAALTVKNTETLTLREKLDTMSEINIDLLLENSSTALADQKEKLHQADQGLAQIEARLELMTGRGLLEKVDRARADLEAAEQTHRAIQTKAAGAKVLYERFAYHRSQQQRQYVKPFSDQLTALGQLVYGQDFQVEVSENLEVLTRTMHGKTIGFDALSGGAKEQLGVLIRLACVKIIDEEHGVPVFIDDALGYTDRTRLSRLSAAFHGLNQAQVIVLTSYPERYQGIGGATWLTLE